MYLVNFKVFVSATRTTYMFRETTAVFGPVLILRVEDQFSFCLTICIPFFNRTTLA